MIFHRRRGWRNEVELIGITQLATSHVDDLLGMTSKMGRCVKNGLHPGDIVSLHRPDSKKFFRRGSGKNHLGICHGTFNLLQQLALWDPASLIELFLPFPNVYCSTNACHDPLPQVATQMKQQICNTVHRFGWPPPDLIIRELVDTVLDLSQCRVKFAAGFIAYQVGQAFEGC